MVVSRDNFLSWSERNTPRVRNICDGIIIMIERERERDTPL